MVRRTLIVLAVVALGLSAGALLAEGAVLIPSWRLLQPESFLAWYRQHAALLVWFFGPLEVVAAVSVTLAALLGWFAGERSTGVLAVAALLAVLVLLAFPLYFQRANASFAEGTIAMTEVQDELQRYSTWHWVRVVVAVTAFVLAVLAAGGHDAQTA